MAHSDAGVQLEQSSEPKRWTRGRTPPAEALVATIVGGAATFLLGLFLVIGVVDRMEGHAKPRIGALVIYLVTFAFVFAVTRLAWHRVLAAASGRAVGRSNVSRRILIAGTVTGIFYSLLLTATFVLGLIHRTEGHPKPRAGALVIEFLFLALSAWFASLCWRSRAKTGTPTGGSDPSGAPPS
jgi:hypothetical protein